MNNLIAATEIDAWAKLNPRRAQELLPELIVRLILCTSSKIKDYFLLGRDSQIDQLSKWIEKKSGSLTLISESSIESVLFVAAFCTMAAISSKWSGAVSNSIGRCRTYK